MYWTRRPTKRVSVYQLKDMFAVIVNRNNKVLLMHGRVTDDKVMTYTWELPDNVFDIDDFATYALKFHYRAGISTIEPFQYKTTEKSRTLWAISEEILDRNNECSCDFYDIECFVDYHEDYVDINKKENWDKLNLNKSISWSK